jgi:hypothetical protein
MSVRRGRVSAQATDTAADPRRIRRGNPRGDKASVFDDGLQLGVDPVSHDLEASRLVDAGRLATHEHHDRAIRRDGFGDHGSEARLGRPVEEVV